VSDTVISPQLRQSKLGFSLSIPYLIAGGINLPIPVPTVSIPFIGKISAV
jgi:hypothetical protein